MVSKPMCMPIATINPANGETVRTFPPLSSAEVDAKIQTAHDAFRALRHTSFAERAAKMRKAADILESEKDRWARIMTLEMGKTLKSAGDEALKCALGCRYYADNAEKFLANEEVATNAGKSFVAYQPLGVVLAVMPWNFPYWQVFRFAAPALMAGNAGVLKHASNVTRCALDIEETFRESGFPAGIFATVIVPGAEVKHLIGDDRIAAVTITGSEPAGVSVASESGRALKKHVLELGGSDAFIVLADADLAAAAKTAAKARFQNAGQSCICGKRFIVEDAIYDRFVAAFIEESKAYKIGDPEDRATTMGPLARADLRDDLIKQITGSVAKGARVVLG